MEEIIRKEDALAEIMNVECFPIPDDFELEEYKRIPITDIASIGAGMSSLPTVFRTATTQMVTNTQNMYQLTNGITLKAASDGSGLLRGFEMGANGIKTQGLFKGVEGLNTTVTTTMPINPATMCMAVAIIGLDKKMDRIIEIEQEILDRIVATERAKLRNNIDFLSEMLRDYKYNWNNERFLDNNHVMALEIKREAGTYIKKYREQIEKNMITKGLIKGDAEVKKAIGKISKDLIEYQIAVYLYAYASFIEVMLQGNFNSEYLREVSNRIESNSIQYRELYTNTYNKLLSKVDSTVQSQIVGALSSVGKAAGNLANKSPLLDMLEVDEAFNIGSKKLSKLNSKKKGKELKRLENRQAVYVRPFIENLAVVDKVFNEPVDILFDDEYVYLPEV